MESGGNVATQGGEVMARKAKSAAAATGGEATGKQRTREHVIAELSINFVEPLVLKCGNVAHRQVPDYGYDLRLDMFDEQGRLEDGQVLLQVKATDSAGRYELATEESFSFPVSSTDYRFWTDAMMPVFLILYDAVLEEGYWLHVQDYALTRRPQVEGDALRLHIPRSQILGAQTIRMMRQRKLAITQSAKQLWPKATKQPEV
jgi:hypothetical protein